jgi:DtxR family Mn-dependent transcriptional regulator
MPTSHVEDYLKSILLAETHEGARVPTGRIADALGVAPASATAMIQALAERELVDYAPYEGARLSAEGRRLAVAVLRKHRLVELLLVEVLGMHWAEVHAEAERLEHAISERVLARIDALLGQPEVDPHGDPIPSAAGDLRPQRFVPLEQLEAGARARVARVLDQDEGFLRSLDAMGLVLGATVRVDHRDAAADTVTLSVVEEGDATVSLGGRAAGKILVDLGPPAASRDLALDDAESRGGETGPGVRS